ncbi:hypothetical protein MJ1_0697 [Nanobdella aerobiophila]|uniref:Uncharacterized protein n=1 Tax=Nanobdella aerobiophila TaxID=2586965 RepID=A0A915SG29_9ARCH|nr:hypothetical protein [Nanobdella aerobiophila]BBL45839.1 hypothetical protein MJ1_0697 [Nanobdella aerobiophila]
MKAIHLYIEYILLLLLSSIAFYILFTWWINNKIYAINFYNENTFNYQSKYIGDILYNLQNDYYYNINFNLNYKLYCLNNLTLIESSNFCKTTLNNMQYNGELIYSYGDYYVYDPSLNGYYLLEYRDNSILYGCYQGYLSTVLLTDNCTGVCVGNDCILNIVKNGIEVYSNIYT